MSYETGKKLGIIKRGELSSLPCNAAKQPGQISVPFRQLGEAKPRCCSEATVELDELFH